MEIRQRCRVKTEAQRRRDIAEADNKARASGETSAFAIISNLSLLIRGQESPAIGGRRAREHAVLRRHESENALVVITPPHVRLSECGLYMWTVSVLQQQSGPDRVKPAALGSPLKSCSQHLLLLRHTPSSLPAVIVSPVNRARFLAAQSIQPKASRLSRVRQLPLFFLLVAGARGAGRS